MGQRCTISPRILSIIIHATFGIFLKARAPRRTAKPATVRKECKQCAFALFCNDGQQRNNAPEPAKDRVDGMTGKTMLRKVPASTDA